MILAMLGGTSQQRRYLARLLLEARLSLTPSSGSKGVISSVAPSTQTGTPFSTISFGPTERKAYEYEASSTGIGPCNRREVHVTGGWIFFDRRKEKER